MAATKSINDTYGIIIYNIELDGCLNGVYKNDKLGIYNEILRKRSRAKDIGEGLFSRYDNQYIDSYGPHTGEVRVKKDAKGFYIFEWSEDSFKNVDFIGIGYKMNTRQIAVYYT
jgi:hypothetical protein